MNNLFKTSIKYGGVCGLIVLVYVTTLVRTEVIYSGGIGQYLGYIAIVVLPICTFLAIKEVNKKYFEYKITFKYALITGLLVAFFAATMYSSLKYAEKSFFSDVYMQRLIDDTTKQLNESGAGLEEIESRVQAIRSHYNSWKSYKGIYIWYIGTGLLYSAGSFAILKYLHKKT